MTKKIILLLFLLIAIFASSIFFFKKNEQTTKVVPAMNVTIQNPTPTLFVGSVDSANLGYITIVICPTTEILVIDPQKRKTGKIIQNGKEQTYDEISDASYGFEGPISNTNDQGEIISLGTGVNSFLFPKPQDGEYTITFSSKTDTFCDTNIVTYNPKGNGEHFKERIDTNPNTIKTMKLHYFQNRKPTLIK